MSEKEPVATEPAVAPAEVARTLSSEAYFPEDPTGDIVLPKGWKYRGTRIAGINIPWYASPKVQLAMVAIVCFMCPGMFNALNGLGGGGRTNQTLGDNMVSPLTFPLCQSYATHLRITEHRSLFDLRRLRFLRWNFRQQNRCEVDLGIWRYWIRPLRY